MKTLGSDSSEGDVETQFVVPLLTRPEFLGIPLEAVRSKEGIASRDIGKGAKQKIGYFPDFCIYKRSLPILVVEAKAPAKDVRQAYAEACLYAAEINRTFPTGINPCCRVLATNGEMVLAGEWDAQPAIELLRTDLKIGSAAVDGLIAFLGSEELDRLSDLPATKLRATDFKRPFNQGAGPSQIISHIEPNTFSADLAPILRRYFSSRGHGTDADIYSRGYISSNEVTSYDRLLESYLKDRLSRSKTRIEITTSRHRADQLSKPISKFDTERPVRGDLQLVTGGVGAGKSLFARRYCEFLQPAPLAKRNHWAFLNFNNAPDDFSDINNWVCQNFIESLLEEGAPLDIRDAQDQERIFAPDLEDRRAFYERMEAAQLGRGALERARDIEGWRQEPLKLARGVSRYLQGDKSENIIAVFDNVDRRDTAQQLSAFQTAMWFIDQTRCLVILQMRDSTFEAYKNTPPLDTYRTGQIFHISPPRFVDVVKRRLELSLEALDKEAPEDVSYRTNSGILITYPKRRAGEFLSGIYSQLFQRPTNFSRVLEALAGRDVRRALDMFMAILTSGHIPDDMVSSVARGTGLRAFPEHIVLRALMRQDYRFFNDDTGFIANIFYCESSWARPSNLLIPEILFYLIGRRKVRGDNGQMGFVAMARILSDMELMGFVRSDVFDACTFALKKGMIEVETSSSEKINEHDCVKATAGGWAHMRLITARVEYLASILPTTPINDPKLSARIYDLMQIENRYGSVYVSQMAGVVDLFSAYLRKQYDAQMMHPGYANLAHSGGKYVLGKIDEALRFARRDNTSIAGQLDLLDG